MAQTDVSGSVPWYRTLNREQWRVLFASNLGWLFDGFEIYALFLTVGFALMLSALTVHFRDIRDLLANLLTLWFFATPIIYPIGQVPASIRPLLNLNPMQPGKRWQEGWLPEQADALAQGEQVVVFLGEKCHACKLWASPLSKINAMPDLPPIIGVLAIEPEAVGTYAREHGISFPVVSMRKSTFARLVDATPTITVIQDGVIQSVDEGVLPPALHVGADPIVEPIESQATIPVVGGVMAGVAAQVGDPGLEPAFDVALLKSPDHRGSEIPYRVRKSRIY